MGTPTYIVVDTETTGLYCWQNDIIQVAAVVLDEDLNEVDHFNANCAPSRPDNVQREALDVNGYTMDQLMSFRNQKLVLKEFFEWSAKYGRLVPVAHNWEFDRDFLQEHARRYKLRMPWDYNAVCTRIGARLMLNLGRKSTDNAKLETLVKYFNIQVEGKLHDALADVRATAEVLRNFKIMIDFMHDKMDELNQEDENDGD